MRKRIAGLALIALAAPFPALALDGDGVEGSGSPGLSVTASLDSCGLADSQILCKIDAGWNSVEGADSYSVSVTAPDGSVVDMGETAGQGSSVWVPYVGSGSYSVTVTAWGTPPDEKEDAKPEMIARSTSFEGEVDAVTRGPASDDTGEGRVSEEGGPVATEPPVVEGEVPGDPREEEPVCEEPPAEEPPLPPAEEPEPPVEGEEAAPAEPEVVDTIPADDDCSS